MYDPRNAADDVETAENHAAVTQREETKAAEISPDLADLRAQGAEIDPQSEEIDGSQLILEDFRQSFVYRVKAAFHLEDYDRNAALDLWSKILRDHVSYGNTKISDTTAIWNLNSAHDCPNRQTEECQVPWSACYAQKAEKQYGTPLAYRRRQNYLTDVLDPETFALAFIRMDDRKRSNHCKSFRVSEAGDFRTNADVMWVNEVAKILREKRGIETYTYSASGKLDWTLATDFTVNASNEGVLAAGGDAKYSAKDGDAELDDGEVWCPNDLEKREGIEAEDRTKCGECRLCIDPDAPDVMIPLH